MAYDSLAQERGTKESIVKEYTYLIAFESCPIDFR